MEPGALVVRAEGAVPVRQRRATSCAGSRSRTAISSGASRCQFTGLEAGTRRSANGCLVLRLRKSTGGVRS